MKTIRFNIDVDMSEYQDELNQIFGNGAVDGGVSFFDALQAVEVCLSDDGQYLGTKAVTYDGKLQ